MNNIIKIQHDAVEYFISNYASNTNSAYKKNITDIFQSLEQFHDSKLEANQANTRSKNLLENSFGDQGVNDKSLVYQSSSEINRHRLYDNIIIIANSSNESILAYNRAKFFFTNHKVIRLVEYPTFYDIHSPQSFIVNQKVSTLSKLLFYRFNNIPFVLVIELKSLFVKLPPCTAYDNSMFIKLGDKFNIDNISKKLTEFGFIKMSTAYAEGEFSIRGDIIDIVLPKLKAYRINTQWDVVESIKTFSIDSQLSYDNVDSILITQISDVILTENTIDIFTKNWVSTFGIKSINSNIYQKVQEYKKTSRIEEFSTLFYEEGLINILDYLPESLIVINNNYEIKLSNHMKDICATYEHVKNLDYTLPVEQKLYDVGSVTSMIKNHSTLIVEYTNDVEKLYEVEKWDAKNHPITIPNFFYNSVKNKSNVTDTLLDFQKEYKKKQIFLCSTSYTGIDKIKELLNVKDQEYEIIQSVSQARKHIFNVCLLNIKKSFCLDQNVFISFNDLFGIKTEVTNSIKKKSKDSKKFQNIVSELSTLQVNDIIVHKDYGVGRFLGIEHVTVKEYKHDCLKIEYAKKEYLYLPVENINSIKKYGSSDAELDKLGSQSFNRRKAILKNKITEIAYKLIETAANRDIIQTDRIEYDYDEYKKFCDVFPYIETADQENAIDEIKKDFGSQKVSDRLICGDVGFGKTEVAMRAAFLVVNHKNSPNLSPEIRQEHKKQVALICPTTILARQHYNTFTQRFKDFKYKICEMSRLISSKDQKIIKAKIHLGEFDIIIGTHALLSDDVKFKNLGLLIIDEEQHFGVKQKEKLKNLKNNIHIISLSATPIPRTLQMSLTGLRALSIIATPPRDRLAVKTIVTPQSDIALKDAIIKEANRGGQVFIVVPRIKYIDDVYKKVEHLIRDLKLTAKVAHGKMSANEIDKVMTEFYQAKFDILLSTTIIESGLDVKNANTIIIMYANILGLSQLYQLRGRVGRSNAQGYAYIMMSPNHQLTKEAIKRFEIMETIDHVGAGFTIASHDMDIRGFGNLVGDSQAGHIKEVGVELYQEMLSNEIERIKNIKTVMAEEDGRDNKTEHKVKHDLKSMLLDSKFSMENNANPNINLNIPIFISEKYISDPNVRVSVYKKIGNLIEKDKIDDFKEELYDRFGVDMPQELKNLFEVIYLKNICQFLGIKSIDAGKSGLLVKYIDSSNTVKMIQEYNIKYKNSTKIKDGNKLVIIRNNITSSKILQEVKIILNDFETIYELIKHR